MHVAQMVKFYNEGGNSLLFVEMTDPVGKGAGTNKT